MDELIEQYKILHAKRPNYGRSGKHRVVSFLNHIKLLTPSRILDYGCGKGDVVNMLTPLFNGVEIVGYDPAVDEFNKEPNGKFDLVISTDVMEHLPEEEIDDFIEQMLSYSSNKKFIFAISCRKAKTNLPNGMNAHLTIWSKKKWEGKLRNYFHVCTEIIYLKDDTVIFKTW